MPRKEKTDVVEICGERYYTLHKAAEVLGISERSLSREINRKNIKWLDHLQGKLFHPLWCEEWVQHRTVQPRKTAR